MEITDLEYFMNIIKETAWCFSQMIDDSAKPFRFRANS